MLGWCFSYTLAEPQNVAQVNPQAGTQPAAGKSATAILAGGCFWCVETDFEKLPGVYDVVSGYSGGRSKEPTYKTYASGGHREVVMVTYNPEKVTYAGL